jgi:mannonate dehydratase
MEQNRRNFIKNGTALAAMSVVGMGSATAGLLDKNDKTNTTDPSTTESKAQKNVQWPVIEGPETPKLCMTTSFKADEKAMRRVKQLGIDYVLMGGPKIPWQEDDLRNTMENFKKGGLTVMNMMIGGFPNTILGREGRDAEIENVKQSLVAAGKVGLPVVEYNFYVHRMTEGYHNVEGRGGSVYYEFDYEPIKNLPPDPETGIHTAEELWNNLTYFLKAVIPVAEKAGVRMALHPNDPPAPVTHGSAQIMGTLKGWKRLIEIVDSPSNGITFDCGVTREIGEDPLEVLRYFASRDRINHHHFRNVNVQIPTVKYVEQFVDEGQVNMFAVMQELVRLKYKLGIFPEHPHGLDADKERGGDYTGYVYNIGYARAMLQAVLTLEKS